MKPIILALTFLFSTGFFTLANDLDALQGTWKGKKSGDNTITQTLEFTKDKWKFTYAIEGGDSFIATGAVQVKKAEGFNIMRLHITKLGPSGGDLNDFDEERVLVFSIQDGKLYAANNFDHQRENENPNVDVYSKTAEAAKSSNELAGSWKLDLELGENKYDYTLRIAEADGKVSAVLVSPRSGEHKVKTISFENGSFKMEIDREIDGNPVTFVFVGKLESKKLAGSAAAKRDGEEIASGTWEAKK